ncbi:MAG: Bacteriocin-protection, YdeI or OmpD-Associated [Candidatus Adlerbacteria bacterium]|nr:Bacteriocin-protection, YdeI or OmpD-Associated [Candidatus Adlerbacteria bacterium]
MPTDLRRALAASAKVQTLWKDLTPLARRDWISWVETAKQAETRKRRVETIGSRLVSGKRRPCCFAIVPMNLYKALNTNAKAKEQWKGLTPNERRDFSNWIELAKESEARAVRVQKVCTMLAAGKRRP